MGVCSAYKCKSRSGKGVKKTFHKFPTRYPDLMKEWVKRIGKGKDWVPSPRAVLCSDHFHEKCFDRTGQNTRIRHLAIPTIFSFTVSKDGEVQDIPKSGTLSYLAKASEIAELPDTHMFLENDGAGYTSNRPRPMISRPAGTMPTIPSPNSTTSLTAMPTTGTLSSAMLTSASVSQSKNTKENKFTHDHTYSVNFCSTDVKQKLDIIHNQMTLMTKKLKQIQMSNNRLTLKEKSLLAEIEKLKSSQETALKRIEELTDSLHFGL